MTMDASRQAAASAGTAGAGGLIAGIGSVESLRRR